jgi:hypothetical protein
MPVRISLLTVAAVAAFVISACADDDSQDLAVQDADSAPAVVETRTADGNSTTTVVIEFAPEGAPDDSISEPETPKTEDASDGVFRIAWIDPPGPEGPFAIEVVDDGKPVEFEVDAPSK